LTFRKDHIEPVAVVEAFFGVVEHGTVAVADILALLFDAYFGLGIGQAVDDPD